MRSNHYLHFGDAVSLQEKSVYPNPSYGIYQLKIPTEFQTGNLVVSDVLEKLFTMSRLNLIQ